MTVELHQGDCLEFMGKMTDKSVDLAFVDPPYNVGKDYGNYKDNLSEVDYLNWCEKWIAELKRVASRVAIYPPKKYTRWFWNHFPEHHQIICAWSPEGAIRFGFSHQYISLLVPNKPLKRVKDCWWNIQIPGLGYYFREDNYGHPGYTSMDVTNRVISAFTQKGETVFDCFMGTGTSGVVAVLNECNFIGIENEVQWFNLAEKRIHDAQQQMRLPLEVE